MSSPSPQSVTDDLNALVEALQAGGQGQAHVCIQALLSDLKELTTRRRNPITRQSFYPAEVADFDIAKTLALRKAMAQVAAEIEDGNLIDALEGCRRELSTWSSQAGNG